MPESPNTAAPAKRSFNAKLNMLASKGKFYTARPKAIAAEEGNEQPQTEVVVPDQTLQPSAEEVAADVAPQKKTFQLNFGKRNARAHRETTPANTDATPSIAPEGSDDAPALQADAIAPDASADRAAKAPGFTFKRGRVRALAAEAKNGAPETLVTYKGSPPHQDEPALDPARIVVDETKYFDAKVAIHEIKVTASAAKALTRLLAAVSMEPGSGNEVPADIRRDTLNHLIEQSHLLADRLSKSVMQDDSTGAPDFLRAKLLQGAADFISDQWVRFGRVDTNNLAEAAEHVFSGQVPALSQDVVDLFDVSESFTPASSEDISTGRITESVIRETWAMVRQVESFDRSDYDPSFKEAVTPLSSQAFSYERDPIDVSGDLMKIALNIAIENKLAVSNLDLYTNYMQNSIRRASTLVRAEYKMLTDRVLRSSFNDDMYSEAAIGQANALYPRILEKIASRARNSYIRVERSALDAMSASRYKHFLPKTENQSVKEETPVSKSAESSDQAPLEARTNDHQDPPSETDIAATAGPAKRKFFQGFRHA